MSEPQPSIATIYLLLGANLGNKQATFRQATDRLANQVGKLLAKSALYESKAWGFESDKLFLNQVLKMETALLPSELLSATQKVEAELGRVRSGKGYESRLIDIDILFYDSLVISAEHLTIPHPLLHNRMFTLAPLSELAPNFVHPVLHKTIAELKHECTDKVVVERKM